MWKMIAHRRTAFIRSEALLITATVSAGVLSSVAGLAMAARHGSLALWTGAPAVACWIATMCLAGLQPDEDDESGVGGVSSLSDEEFDDLLEDVERRAHAAPVGSPGDADHFAQLVRDALDELPDHLQASLGDNVAVLVSDEGIKEHGGCYGLYHGGTVAHGGVCHTILICRDTLVRDFGHDPHELCRQVAITVRHEVAHHLGASERRVWELGL